MLTKEVITRGNSTEAFNMRLSSIARAVTRNDVRLASTLVAHAAREHLMISGEQVMLRDPIRFQQVVSESKLKESESSWAELDEDFKGQRLSQMQRTKKGAKGAALQLQVSRALDWDEQLARPPQRIDAVRLRRHLRRRHRRNRRRLRRPRRNRCRRDE